MPQMNTIIVPMVVLGWLSGFARRCREYTAGKIDESGMCTSLCRMGVEDSDEFNNGVFSDDVEEFMFNKRIAYRGMIINIMRRNFGNIKSERNKRAYRMMILFAKDQRAERGCDDTVICSRPEYAEFLKIMCREVIELG